MYKLAALYTFILFKSFDNKCTHVHARTIGEIGEISSESGRAEFRVTNKNFKVWDIIGRSCVVHNRQTSEDNR
jgi:hypothetical protein